MNEDATDKEEVLKALREAQPDWRKEGSLRVPLSRTVRQAETEFPPATVTRSISEPKPSTDVTQQNVIGSRRQSDVNVSFLLRDASTTVDDETTYKVLVLDGKINGEFPSGMGSGNYILTISDPTDAIIYAGITFNPTTLAITSRFLDVTDAASYPVSRIENDTDGFIYWSLGFTYLDVNGTFKIWNQRLGDINFAFSYGKNNGAIALLPIDSGPGWIDATDLLS